MLGAATTLRQKKPPRGPLRQWRVEETPGKRPECGTPTAVLVAISIPIFTTQLERSRDAVTTANLRAAYAEAMSELIAENKTTSSSYAVDCKGTRSDSDLSGTSKELPFEGAAITTIAGYTSAQTAYVTFSVDENDKVTAAIGTAPAGG